LFRAKRGLIIRAVGNSHLSAHVVGYGVIRVRYACVLFGGACSGLAGGYLTLVYTPQWIENMTGGRGWFALAGPIRRPRSDNRSCPTDERNHRIVRARSGVRGMEAPQWQAMRQEGA
jgi:hypothetical protein